MLPHRYDPFFRRQIPCGASFFLIGTVVDHQPMYTVKGRLVRENVCFLIYKVVVHFIVGYDIHRVLQNRLDGEARVVLAVFRLDAALHQFCFRVRQRIRLLENLVNQPNRIRFFRDQLQLTGLFRFTVHRYVLDALRCVPCRGRSAQPTAGLCQFVHIVADTLGNRLTLQL